MKDLERKIERLEKIKESTDLLDEKAIQNYFDSENIHPLERISILIDLGLLDIKTVIEMIMYANNAKVEK